MSDKLHDIAEAQALLGGISRTTLFELLRTGRIGSVRVGRRRMIPRSQIEKYIADSLEIREPA